MKTLLTAWVGLLVAGGAPAETEIKGTPTELAAYLTGIPKPVVITAEGEARYPADKAIITLRVVTDGKGLQPTIKANQEGKNRLVAFLKEQGVSENLVQGSRFSSTPKYGAFSEKAKSYRVDNQLQVTVHDDKGFQAVALAVDTLSEIRYVGIEFEHSDKENLKGKAIAQACERALLEKKVYEEKLGVKLVPRRFSTLSDPTPADLRRAAKSESEKIPYVSGILSDPSYRMQTHALEQREDSVALFGEISAKVLVTIEFSVEIGP